MSNKTTIIYDGQGWDSMAKALNEISIFPNLNALSGAKIGRWILIKDLYTSYYLIIHCGDGLRVLYVDEAFNTMMTAKS